jgi:hypothetical protein
MRTTSNMASFCANAIFHTCSSSSNWSSFVLLNQEGNWNIVANLFQMRMYFAGMLPNLHPVWR